MPASNLLALIDDIATLLDDVAVMSKVAVKKTAGVLGDDLALNAQQVTGISADREFPVVWAVAKGSLLNKAILVPAALGISLVAPGAILPLLMLGGLFLCYEGCEKLAHKFLASRHDDEQHHVELVKAVANPAVDIVAFEKDKIRGAIRTDFILSAEIIVITLGTVGASPLSVRILTLVSIALLMTVGVYGLVAAIVKLDDLGRHLHRSSGGRRHLGAVLLRASPVLMKGLSIAGTAAMFLVGGGIVVHGIPALHHALEGLPAALSLPAEAAVGLVAGALVLGLVHLVRRARGKPSA